MGEKTSIWQTDELRRSKPAPVDEARAGKLVEYYMLDILYLLALGFLVVPKNGLWPF